MQKNQSNTGSAGPVNHPEAGEWMSFLYGELGVRRKRELEAHAAQCAECAAQLRDWRGATNALNAWTLPMKRPLASQWQPMVKWAAAAAVVLGLGFFSGRLTANTSSELNRLKQSVAQLEQSMNKTAVDTNATGLAVAAATEETTRLLADFSRLQEEQRTADRETLSATLRALDTRLVRLRAELETVAYNTESGFQETKENLSRVIELSSNNTQ